MTYESPCKAASYDIVVVGGGTAGCVLATRLSEIPNLNVLVLEAGGNHNDDPRVQIPALVAQAIGDPNLDWNFQTVPQRELNGKAICQARGKGLGGSSLINLLGLVYPSKVGFDAWSDMGNPGWDWTSMKPYLQKFQTFHMPEEAVQRALHLENIDESAQGQNGPIHASYQHEPGVLDKAWIETFHNMGHSMKGDTMSGHSLGGYQITSSIDPKMRERSHAGNGYLDLSRDRPNLEIISNVQVEKVTFTADDTPRASGVIFDYYGRSYSVKVDKEVILCSGVFGSPNLLERSGIGRDEVLKNLGLPILVQNENVGENLQDHLMIAVSFELKEGIDTVDNFRDPSYVQSAMEQYQKSRTGPLAGACVNFAYMPLQLDAEKEEQRSKLQELVDTHVHDDRAGDATPVNRGSREFCRRVLLDSNEASANVCLVTSQAHLEHNSVAKMFELTDSGNYISIYTALSHPLSRGSVHITSTSTSAPPRIDPRYFSHPLDLKVMVEHVHELFPRIISTSPLADLLKPDGRRIPQYADFSDPRVTEKVIRERCASNLHPCGTCAMLPRDQGGVVDPRLSCYGVKGLRIIDASIMPIIPRGNIMSSVYALAEKGADIVKEDLAAAS